MTLFSVTEIVLVSAATALFVSALVAAFIVMAALDDWKGGPRL